MQSCRSVSPASSETRSRFSVLLLRVWGGGWGAGVKFRAALHSGTGKCESHCSQNKRKLLWSASKSDLAVLDCRDHIVFVTLLLFTAPWSKNVAPATCS